jgi:hypothetical protein
MGLQRRGQFVRPTDDERVRRVANKEADGVTRRSVEEVRRERQPVVGILMFGQADEMLQLGCVSDAGVCDRQPTVRKEQVGGAREEGDKIRHIARWMETEACIEEVGKAAGGGRPKSGIGGHEVVDEDVHNVLACLEVG